METKIDELLAEYNVKVRARAFIQHVPEFLFDPETKNEIQEEFMDKYNAIVGDHSFQVQHTVHFIVKPEAEEAEMISEQVEKTETLTETE